MSVRPSINITILQGADFSESFLSQESDSSATDLTGYTAYSQLKKHSGASSSFPLSVIEVILSAVLTLNLILSTV